MKILGFDTAAKTASVALLIEFLETCHLFGAHFSVVDFEDIDWSFFFKHIFVYADNGLASGVDTGLCAGSGFFDTHFGHTGYFLNAVYTRNTYANIFTHYLAPPFMRSAASSIASIILL